MRRPKGKSSTRINKVLNNRVVGILNGRVGAVTGGTLLCVQNEHGVLGWICKNSMSCDLPRRNPDK